MADQLLDTLTEQVVTRIVEVLSPLKNEYEPTTASNQHYKIKKS